MSHCSISGALVQSNNSINYDPMFGNLELSAQLRPHAHLFPIWNLLPHQTDECPAPTALAEMLPQHNVRAVSIHPALNGWDWEADHADTLLAWLQEQKMLCVLKKGELGDWRATDRFLKRYPDLPVLLISAGWSDQRYLLPLLQQHRQLHITFDCFQVHYGLEYLCAVGCEDQLVYGSNAPLMCMGAHRAYIDYADVPSAVKAKIAGGNLTRLLHGLQPPRECVNRDEDKLMTAARQGRPLPIPVVDMHMHTRFGFPYHDKVWSPWWELGNERQYYALIHRTRNDFVEVDVLAAKFPRIRWVAAHCGSDFKTADQAIACMAAHPNVYAEITLTPVTLGIIDYLVKHAGADRILYGSDLPMRDPRQQLGWVVFSRLSPEDKCKVLYENACRIISPCLEQLPEYNRPVAMMRA